MNVRTWLILLLTIIWFLIGGVYDWVCKDCSNQNLSGPSVASGEIPKGAMGLLPLSFDWSSDAPGSEGKLIDFLNAKLANYNGEDSLVITGHYFPGEEAPDGFATMGFARAQKIKDLLIRQVSSGKVNLPNFDPNKIILRSKELDERAGMENTSFEGGDLTLVPPSISLAPVVFNWDDDNPIVGKGLSSYLSELLANYNGEDSLEITGYYYSDEQAPTGFANMGLARAQKLKDLLLNQISSGEVSLPNFNPDLVKLSSKLLDYSDNARIYPFSGSPIFDFAALSPQSTLPDIEGKAIVYFPYNSTTRIPDGQFDTYVGNLVEVLLKSNASLSIVGHTDNRGGEAYNENLGLNRARIIKQMLVERGVDADRISISSKGYTEPASDNDTDKGRQLNRRAELFIKQ